MAQKNKRCITHVNWPEGQEFFAEELQKRAGIMHIADSLYCRMVLIRELKSSGGDREALLCAMKKHVAECQEAIDRMEESTK